MLVILCVLILIILISSMLNVPNFPLDHEKLELPPESE